jgi:hypothetical protein
VLDLCQNSLEKAVSDYDGFIFANSLLSIGGKEITRKLSKWRPELNQEVLFILPEMSSYPNYDSFNIDNFYAYCNTSPTEYTFCDLERS